MLSITNKRRVLTKGGGVETPRRRFQRLGDSRWEGNDITTDPGREAVFLHRKRKREVTIRGEAFSLLSIEKRKVVGAVLPMARRGEKPSLLTGKGSRRQRRSALP